jgi:hypothetical protein
LSDSYLFCFCFSQRSWKLIWGPWVFPQLLSYVLTWSVHLLNSPGPSMAHLFMHPLVVCSSQVRPLPLPQSPTYSLPSNPPIKSMSLGHPWMCSCKSAPCGRSCQANHEQTTTSSIGLHLSLTLASFHPLFLCSCILCLILGSLLTVYSHIGEFSCVFGLSPKH